MESWWAEAHRAMHLAVVPSTKWSYTAACAKFFSFREKEGLQQDWLPMDDHMIQFTVHLHRKGLVPQSIQGRMSALAFYAKVQGCRGYSVDFHIKKLIRGLG